MLMVLVLHLNSAGGFLQTNSHTLYSFLITLTEHLSIVAVNVFIIISAWFMNIREVRYTKVIDLILTILFWSVVMSGIAYVLGVEIGLKDCIKQIPIIGRAYDFLSGYIILYLMSPYLNKMQKSLSLRQHFCLSATAFLLFSLLSPITLSHYLQINGGYSFIWFIILYLITGLFRRYPLSLGRFPYLIVYMIVTMTGTIFDFYSFPVLGRLEYNHPLVAIAAFSLFLFFQNLKIDRAYLCKIIAKYAPYTLAVFLIHANYLFAKWYISLDFSKIFSTASSYTCFIVICPLVIYVLCTYMDKGRRILFKVMKTDAFSARVENLISRMIDLLLIRTGITQYNK